MSLVLTSNLVFQALYPAEAPLEKRLQALDQHFDPPFGHELKVDRVEMREKRDRPLEIQGHVKVTPPQGGCLIVRRSTALPDVNVCKPSHVPFNITEIQADGSIHWLIISGPQDSGTPVFWETPYRMARFIPLGDFIRGRNKLIPIAHCTAEKTQYQRKVSLELMSGQRWVVLFPENDTLIDPNKKRPNLFVRVMTTGSDGKSHAVEASSGGEGGGGSTHPIPSFEGEEHDRHAILALRLSGRYREVERHDYYYNFDIRGSYEMESARFMERNAPMGMRGQCRYRYQGAPGDPQSGVLECFNTESYDAVYLHMTCSASLQPESR